MSTNIISIFIINEKNSIIEQWRLIDPTSARVCIILPPIGTNFLEKLFGKLRTIQRHTAEENQTLELHDTHCLEHLELIVAVRGGS